MVVLRHLFFGLVRARMVITWKSSSRTSLRAPQPLDHLAPGFLTCLSAQSHPKNWKSPFNRGCHTMGVGVLPVVFRNNRKSGRISLLWFTRRWNPRNTTFPDLGACVFVPNPSLFKR